MAMDLRGGKRIKLIQQEQYEEREEKVQGDIQETNRKNADETIIEEKDEATVNAENKSEGKTKEKTGENPTNATKDKHDK